MMIHLQKLKISQEGTAQLMIKKRMQMIVKMNGSGKDANDHEIVSY